MVVVGRHPVKTLMRLTKRGWLLSPNCMEGPVRGPPVANPTSPLGIKHNRSIIQVDALNAACNIAKVQHRKAEKRPDKQLQNVIRGSRLARGFAPVQLLKVEPSAAITLKLLGQAYKCRAMLV